MITKQQVANVLKQYVDKSVTIFANRRPNKINNQVAKKVISVGDSNLDREANIKTGEYDQKSFKLTIKYNEVEEESESFSNSLYQTVKDIKNVALNDTNNWLFTWHINKPVSTGKVKDNIYEYHMDVDMKYDKKTDEEIFNEYVLENEENVSSFDTSNSHIKYASSVDKSKKIISYSMKVTDIDEELGKSGEIFIPSMYSKDGFRKSLEKNGYECK